MNRARSAARIALLTLAVILARRLMVVAYGLGGLLRGIESWGGTMLDTWEDELEDAQRDEP